MHRGKKRGRELESFWQTLVLKISLVVEVLQACISKHGNSCDGLQSSADAISFRSRSTSTQSLMAEQIGTEALEHEDLLRVPSSDVVEYSGTRRCNEGNRV